MKNVFLKLSKEDFENLKNASKDTRVYFDCEDTKEVFCIYDFSSHYFVTDYNEI